MKKILFVFALIVPLQAMAARSDMPVQGYVTDSESGDPIDGRVPITFRLYSDCEASSVLWSEAQLVDFNDGLYSTTIEPDDDIVTENEDLCLGITIGSDEEMSPRISYHAVPFAKLSNVADFATTAETANVALSVNADNLPDMVGAGLDVSGDNIVLDTTYSQTWTGSQTYNSQVVVTRNPSTTNSSDASFKINPPSATANAKTLVVQDNGTDAFTVDKEGDVVISGDLTVLGATNLSGVGDITSITAGSGLTGTTLVGDATINIGSGSGISVGADTVSLGVLSADWNQTGGFDLILNHASSELKILESADNVFYGIIDVTDLTADRTYTFPDVSGTVSILGQTIESSEISNDTVTGTDVDESTLVLTGLVDDDDLAAGAVDGGAAGEIADNSITVADLAASLSFVDADLVDLSSINASSATEGLKLPQATDVSAATAEGQISWDTDGDTLYVGTGSGVQAITSGSGDITDVGNATSGAVFKDGTDNGTELVYEGATVDTNENRLTFTGDPGADTIVTIPNITGTLVTTGDTGTVDTTMIANDTVTGTDVDESTLVLTGLVDDDDLAAGAVDGGAAGEIADNSITVADLAASLSFADADLVDLSSINASSTTEGLKLPQATDVSAATAEGQISWDTDGDTLYVGTGASAAAITPRQNKCITVENLAAADDNVPMFVFNKAATLVETSCYTTSSTIPSYTLEDNSGNAVTGAGTCVNSGNATWTSTSSGNTFVAGETLRFDTGTAADSSTFTTICVAYTEYAQ